MLKELYDRIKKFVIKKPPLLYAIALVITFIVPVIIARLVFSSGVLPDFPGSASEWFAFWASYSGAVVTVFVAVNGMVSNAKLDEVQKQLKNRKEKYFLALTGINFRLNDVFLIPGSMVLDHSEANAFYCDLENSSIGKRYTKYRMKLFFENVSYTPIQNIKATKIELKFEKDFMFKTGSSGKGFSLQGDIPILDIDIFMESGGMIEREFTPFYFYFSQFPRRGNLLKMTIEFQVTAADIQFSEVSSEGKGDEGTKRKADSNNKSEESNPISCIMELELEMLPVFEQEYRSNKVKLKSYSMRVGQIDKDNLDFQKLA